MRAADPALSASCGAADTEAAAAAARAKAEETWKLSLDGAEPLALERMDIVEPESPFVIIDGERTMQRRFAVHVVTWG